MKKLPVVLSLFAVLPFALMGCDNDEPDTGPIEVPSTVTSVSPSPSVSTSMYPSPEPCVSVSVSVSASPYPSDIKKNDKKGDGGVSYRRDEADRKAMPVRPEPAQPEQTEPIPVCVD